MPLITVDGLPSSVTAWTKDRALLASMVDAANSRAVRLAPCLGAVRLEAGAVGSGGSLDGMYRWVVTMCGPWGESIASDEVTATLSAGSTQALAWTSKEDATSVRIYRASGLTGAYPVASLVAELTSENGVLASSYTDTGSAAGAGSPPATDRISEARLILIGAITRWSKAWSCTPQPNAEQPSAQPGFLLFPNEITQLKELCGKGAQKAYTVDTAPGYCGTHQPWCSIMLGALYCSCGVDLTGAEPLWEY